MEPLATRNHATSTRCPESRRGSDHKSAPSLIYQGDRTRVKSAVFVQGAEDISQQVGHAEPSIESSGNVRKEREGLVCHGAQPVHQCAAHPNAEGSTNNIVLRSPSTCADAKAIIGCLRTWVAHT